jgi:hypothetical protein
MLHACVEGLSFPLGYRVYRGKGKATVVDLALELLAAFPTSMWSPRTVVLADAGFGSSALSAALSNGALSVCWWVSTVTASLPMVVSLRSLSSVVSRSPCTTFLDTPLAQLVRRKTRRGEKAFLCRLNLCCRWAYLARRYRRRWLIESFFKSIKHDFGLKEARLRTQTGIRLWIFLACLAYSFASLARHLSQHTLTLPEAAAQVFDALVDVRLIHLMIDCECFSGRSLRPLKLVPHKCKT